jgi:hypothetical protein
MLIEFLQRTNASIIIPTILNIPLLRENDDYIMECAHRWSQLPQALYYINQCRLYLQVTTIAEISDSNGLNLLEAITQPTATNLSYFR